MIKATLRNPALRKRATQFGRLVRHSAVTPRAGHTHKPRLVTNGELGVTFIGHASFFVQMGGQSLVIDPNFARWLFVLKRLRRPGLRVRDLPPIDLVLVTHAHFDHILAADAIRERRRYAGFRLAVPPISEKEVAPATPPAPPVAKTPGEPVRRMCSATSAIVKKFIRSLR